MFNIYTRTQSIILEHKNHARAEILPFGALLHAYALLQKNGEWFNAIQGYENPEQARSNITQGFRSAKLSPFVCRMKNARYRFNEQEHHCQKHNRKGHALHGLIYDQDFQIGAQYADDNSAWIELHHHYRQNEEGYPFCYRIDIRYTLSAEGLKIASTVSNSGTEAIPIADGWHPYFRLGGQADTWQLYINSQEQLEFDQDLLPTGKRIPDQRFSRASLIGDTMLDNSFVLQNYDGAACHLENAQFRLSLYPDDSYPYLQIYIPPERQSIALENLSGAPDCFNNGMGLHILAPNSRKTFRTRYQLSEK